MAIIYSYPYDQIITDTDAWVGTDSVNRQTKQYTAKAVADYLNINGKVAIAGQMNYQFVQEPSYKSGTFAFAGSGGDNTRWSSITSIVISNMDLSGQIVSPFLEYLVDEQVMFQDVADKGSFGHYIMRGYTQIGTTNFYTLTLEYIGGNGSININHYYTLVNFYLEQGDSKVETIDTTNTTFIDMTPTSPTSGDVTITASLSATGTPDNTKFLRGDNFWSTVNLQSVLTIGNTYVSSDGYGTFTLNDIANNDGSITFVNPNEGWGYQISAEEGINITDGSGTNLMSIYSSGLSIRNGAQIMNIGTNALTATRNVYFPDASGTIALENVSEWYNVTGSRGLGNLVVKIGDYDGSGNGTFLTVDDSDESMFFTKGNLVESKFVFAATQDRDYTFPDADGTIALTSDIPAAGPGGSGTTNYTARWTNANTLGIGTLYDNGTNVGIGTTSPAYILDVVSSGTATARLKSAGTGAISLRYENGGGFKSAAVVDNNGLYRLDATNISLNPTNNVGIGTTSPSSKFQVSVNDGDGITLKHGASNAFYILRDGSDDTIIKQTRNYTSKISISTLADSGTHESSGLNIVGQGVGLKSNVGIGTASPSEKLEVAGNIVVNGSNDSADGLHLKDRTFVAFSDAGSVVSRFRSSASGIFQFQDGSYNTNIVLNNNGNSYLNGGNVGIGTTSPGSTLPTDSETASKVLQLTGAGGSTGDTAVLLRSLDNSSGLDLWHNVSSGDSYIDNRYNSNQGDTIFRVKTAGTPLEALRITGNGNVGIGTTSPSAALEVVGGIKLSDNSPLTWATSNTRIFGQAGYMQFQVGSTDKMRITSSGNVGIGTTSPSTKLHVQGAASGYLFRVQGTSTLNVYDPGAAAEIGVGSGSGDKLKLFSNDSLNNGITIDTSGNVGIGTTSPGYPLEVDGIIKTSTSFLGTTVIIQKVTALNTNGIQFANNGGSEKMRITDAGNVGIGTTSPLSKLNVNGDIKIEGENELYFGSSGSVPLWEIKASGSDLVINDTGSNIGSVLFNNDEGIVLPRLTTTEINAISLPNTGLTVYNTTLNTLCFYNGSSWQKVSHTNM